MSRSHGAEAREKAGLTWMAARNDAVFSAPVRMIQKTALINLRASGSGPTPFPAGKRDEIFSGQHQRYGAIRRLVMSYVPSLPGASGLQVKAGRKWLAVDRTWTKFGDQFLGEL